jgi:transposase
MKCPKCKSTKLRKDGKAKGKQRYNCKDCNYHFTVERKSNAAPEVIKKQALQLYLEGLGFRSIGRFLEVSHVAVYKWIRQFGEKLDSIRSEQKIQIVELDELHTYIRRKKTIVGYGLLLIEMGKNSSIAYLVQEKQRQEKNSGTQ